VVQGTKYRSIARILAEEIRGFTDGQRVPSGNEVAQRFAVARSTARAALQYLTTRKVIRRVRGAGSFASHRIDYPIDAQRAPSWSATVRAAGACPRSVVRLSFVNDVPAVWGIEWVPATLVPDLALAMRANDSLHKVLTNAGLSPRRSWVHARPTYSTAPSTAGSAARDGAAGYTQFRGTWRELPSAARG
jgi:DNA-binding GntR family transcriptional regulator